MSGSINTGIVTNGLVFYMDTANTQKSFIGAPTTNLYVTGGNFSPWSQGTINDVTGTSLQGPIANAKTWQFIKTGSSSQWHGWEGTYGSTWTGSAGDIWTTGYWYKTDSPAGQTGFGVGGFYLGDWSKPYNYTVLSNTSTIIPDGLWHYNSTTTQINEAYSNAIVVDGPSWGYSTTPGTLYINGLQWEKKSFATPYAKGVRSSTQGLLDLIGGTTLDLTSAGYSSNGNLTFNGSGNYISGNATGLPTGSSSSTVLVWCKPDSTGPSDQYTGLVCWGSRAGTAPAPSSARLLSLYTSGTTMYVSSAFWGNDWTPNSLSVTANAWNMVGMISRGSGANNVTLISGGAAGLNSITGSSSSYALGLNTPASSLTIGCTDNPGRYLKGSIGAVLIFNRELSSTEIAKIFQAMKPRFGL